ncbi:MAG: hypothetical protein ACK44C_09880, partial [Polaromonas sp.]
QPTPPAAAFTPRPPQRFQRFQDAGQALFPRAFTFEAGFYVGQVRIPRDGGHHSTVMADIVPPSSRTPFHGDGGQRSILKADTPAVF